MKPVQSLTVNSELLPHILGEGGLFAFSGWDGETNARSEFVATWGEPRLSLLFHTPQRRWLYIPAQEHKVRFVTGDACVLEAPGEGPGTKLAYAAWHTLIGETPHAEACLLSFEQPRQGLLTEQTGRCSITVDPVANDAIVLVTRGPRFALAYGVTPEEALGKAEQGLSLQAEAVIEERLGIYRSIPVLASERESRLLRKCVSVMKVNTLAPEAERKRYWSTPDRVPHKHMWLWDTVFHSIAMNRLSPQISADCLMTMLEAQTEDGMLPHQVSVTGKASGITQPPIMAWGVWENYRHHGDRAWLAETLPRLEAYLLWNRRHRDTNGNELLEWDIKGDVLCRSGESGMDNSSRFDEADKQDAVDFNVFMARDLGYVARICRELGDDERAVNWEQLAKRTTELIVQTMWDAEDEFFYDVRMDGRFSKVKSVSGFLPLLLDGLSEEQVDGLIRMMKDERHFMTRYPLPSIAVSEPSWSTDMWRGPVWINMNYLVILGLRAHNRPEEARWLQERTIELVNRYYEAYGVTFEYYDSKDERPPVACDRKGPRKQPYNIRAKYDSIRDYHWTAALVADLLWPAEQH
ncbi:hypothetical protein PAESOLCIP111_04280 [Paenibacillus solanacearum]|uniref:Mannosylglycerate hydrolase MGH1-like glycoside hydrolase domain-containing protein n=1 Tax=Paenibacillus solanacearum TaxID=2048548 RepID=A0A916K7U9_9BACL|nr:trehalase family glycosidase [Paenibacillus solanacearum]CAG7641885.1 hypothetical protein PAESOLCIP111_04280 [Paenibacillus solanacearum]